MHDHEFERQVHDRLEELHVSPSEAVWTRVQGQLHKKERRRRFLWIPFFFMALSLGGYFFFHHAEPAARAMADHPARTRTITPANPAGKKGADTGAISITGKDPHHLATTDPSLTPIPHPTQNATPLPASGPAASNTAVRSGRVHNASGHRDATMLSSDIIAEPTGQPAKRSLTGLTKPVIAQLDQPQKNIQADGTNSLPVTGHVAPDSLLAENPRDPAASTPNVPLLLQAHPGISLHGPDASTSAPQAIRLKVNRLAWGFYAEGDRTSLRRGTLLSLMKSATSADALLNPNSPTGGSTTPSNGVAASSPATVQTGWGITAGGFVRKKISRHIAVSTGLQYALFTTSMLVGTRIDSAALVSAYFSASAYYTSRNTAPKETYVNRYHFLELPLSLEMQLNRSQRMPLVLTTGLTVSQLVATNALHYSYLVGGYYKDNSLFNRTQLSLHAGFDLQVLSRTAHPLRIGPHMQYAVSRLLPASANSNNHLLRYGVRISTVLW